MRKLQRIVYIIILLVVASISSWYFTIYLTMVIGYSLVSPNKVTPNPDEKIWNEKLMERKAEINGYALPRLLVAAPFAIGSWILLIKSIKSNKKSS